MLAISENIITAMIPNDVVSSIDAAMLLSQTRRKGERLGLKKIDGTTYLVRFSPDFFIPNDRRKRVNLLQ
jgi:hypothetical protein